MLELNNNNVSTASNPLMMSHFYSPIERSSHPSLLRDRLQIKKLLQKFSPVMNPTIREKRATKKNNKNHKKENLTPQDIFEVSLGIWKSLAMPAQTFCCGNFLISFFFKGPPRVWYKLSSLCKKVVGEPKLPMPYGPTKKTTYIPNDAFCVGDDLYSSGYESNVVTRDHPSCQAACVPVNTHIRDEKFSDAINNENIEKVTFKKGSNMESKVDLQIIINSVLGCLQIGCTVILNFLLFRKLRETYLSVNREEPN